MSIRGVRTYWQVYDEKIEGFKVIFVDQNDNIGKQGNYL